eukprot:TRINITY_DN14224_c0_g1_i2.p1 TRINITY_DN14224_c0_g1~~TRINITY_DN14224_c0_g1_i2.p1  ORF type:complete len:212 (+),score=18.04 TRINITY_DN14224_c0_g1_i2:148-783(+)
MTFVLPIHLFLSAETFSSSKSETDVPSPGFSLPSPLAKSTENDGDRAVKTINFPVNAPEELVIKRDEEKARVSREIRGTRKRAFKLLRNPNEVRQLRSARTNPGVSKKLKCHLCRQKKDVGKLLVCTNFHLCHHAFCYDCIARTFRAKAKYLSYLKEDEGAWPCFTCRGLCKCSRCKQSLIDELNFLKESNLEKELSNKLTESHALPKQIA